MNHWLVLPLLLPLLAGMVNLLLGRERIRQQRWVSIAVFSAVLAVAINLLASAGNGTPQVYRLGNWPPPFGIVLVLDRLSGLLLVTASLLALLSLLHAVRGGDGLGPSFHVFFPLQLLGINGAFLTGDLFNLFVFFEILLIASYCLALYGGGGQRVRAGLHYVVLNLVGSALFLLALGTLYGILGTLNMADMAVKIAAAGADSAFLLQAGGMLLLVVFALKGAIVPLNGWLSPLYGAVTPPVAALFAVMTKVGIYAILRVTTLIFPAQGVVGRVIAGLLPPLALLTLAAGGLGLLAAARLRNLISALVILSVGTLLAGIGTMNAQGLTAALYYLPHTTLVSGGLYLLTDHLARQRGAWEDRLVRGTAPVQARLGGLFLLGAVAAGGLPPLAGFLGKLMLLRAVDPVEGKWLWGLVLGGGLVSLVGLSRAGIRLFWGGGSTSEGEDPVGWLRLLPAALLLATSLAMTLAAAPLGKYAEATAHQLLSPQAYIQAVLGGPNKGEQR